MTDRSEKTKIPPHPSVAHLLAWYDQHRRVLPWRAARGEIAEPYHVWLSEIMLQQTTVVTVKPYFDNFKRLFPTVHDLARAKDDDVMTAWAGLGYYSRARNLLKCARLIVAEHDGVLPNTEAALLKLPGIGPYTAAAIAAIAFGQATAPVDGNIERVLSRIYAMTTPLPALKAKIKPRAEKLVPHDRPGDFAQALMDLGATICTPKRPKCALCPRQNACRARTKNIADTLPRRAAKKPKPERTGTVYWLQNTKGEVLMQRRPNKGLLGGMMMFPSTGWLGAGAGSEGARVGVGSEAGEMAAGEIVHVFTHFRLTLRVYKATLSRPLENTLANTFSNTGNLADILADRLADSLADNLADRLADNLADSLEKDEFQWVHPRDFHTRALPSVMQKVAKLVLG